jgi:hypothetical protein
MNIADIANAAASVSAIKQNETRETVEIKVLKKVLDLQKQEAESLASLLKDVLPHIAQNVDIQA